MGVRPPARIPHPGLEDRACEQRLLQQPDAEGCLYKYIGCFCPASTWPGEAWWFVAIILKFGSHGDRIYSESYAG